MLGCEVCSAFTLGAEVHAHHTVATNYSLVLRKDLYCTIESDWADTPLEALDFHTMTVELRTEPKDVPIVMQWGMLAIGEPHTSIRLDEAPPGASCEVSRIDILEYVEAGTSESVRYDRALVFHRSEASPFMLSTHHSIRGGLQLSYHPADLEELLSMCTVRRSLVPKAEPKAGADRHEGR